MMKRTPQEYKKILSRRLARKLGVSEGDAQQGAISGNNIKTAGKITNAAEKKACREAFEKWAVEVNKPDKLYLAQYEEDHFLAGLYRSDVVQYWWEG